MRTNISSGATWEDIVGYSRAVRVGNIVEVSGTSAVDGDRLVGKGSAEEQARFIFQKIERALHEADATLADVVRTRMYVVNIEDWEGVGKVHGEFFRAIKPAATLLQVSQLIHPDLLVEIEVTAVVDTEK